MAWEFLKEYCLTGLTLGGCLEVRAEELPSALVECRWAAALPCALLPLLPCLGLRTVAPFCCCSLEKKSHWGFFDRRVLHFLICHPSPPPGVVGESSPLQAMVGTAPASLITSDKSMAAFRKLAPRIPARPSSGAVGGFPGR